MVKTDTVTVPRESVKLVHSLAEKRGRRVEELEAEVARLKAALQSGKRAERFEPPVTAYSRKQKFQVGDIKGHLFLTEYDDGNPAEVFVMLSNEGSLEAGLTNDLAKLMSISLQYGVPISEIVRAIKGRSYGTAGPVVYDPDIKGATSLGDYLAKRLHTDYVVKKKVKAAAREEKKIEAAIESLQVDEIKYPECPACKKNTLKPKAQGCNSVCIECGYMVAGGCGE